MLYELTFVADCYGQGLPFSEAFKTKEEAEKRAKKIKLIMQARNVRIIKHRKAKKYIIDGGGHRQYAE